MKKSGKVQFNYKPGIYQSDINKAVCTVHHFTGLWQLIKIIWKSYWDKSGPYKIYIFFN